MRKLACSMIALLLLCAVFCPADSLADALLSAEVAERLRDEGELRNTLNAGSPPILIPDVAVRGDIERRIGALELTVGTEVLSLYRNEAVDFDSPDSRLKIYNTLRSISTMEGIEYYSASRKRMRRLFDRSYVIAAADSTQPLPDPVVRDIPTFSSLYVFQEDLTFGENVYLWEYSYPGGYFLIANRNLTTMRYFLFPMVKPLDSLTYILLIPAGDEILFYGATGARTMRFFGVERSREDSFYNRLKAIYGWFSGRITSAF